MVSPSIVSFLLKELFVGNIRNNLSESNVILERRIRYMKEMNGNHIVHYISKDQWIKKEKLKH